MKERTEEEKQMRRYNIHRIGVTVIQAIAFALAIWLLIAFMHSVGIAETYDDWEDEGKYILCMDRVNIRMSPNTKQEPIGWLEPGDVVYPDGKRRNGFIHCEIPNIEAGEGWIHKGYLVDDPPEKVNQTGVIVGRGKVMVRKYVNGKRTRWVKPGGEVRVYWWSDDWCLTSVGYIKTRFVELEGE